MSPDLVILRSVHHFLRTLFQSGDLMGTPITPYTEDDMRAGIKPEFPYVYLVNFGTLFEVQHLPLIVIQLTIYSVPLEMGGDAVLDCDLNLHIFGRDPIQTANYKGAFRRLEAWALYDFDDPIVPIRELSPIIENDRGELWSESAHSINDNSLAIEASLLAWSTMSCSFQVTTL